MAEPDPDLPTGGRFVGGMHRFPLRVFFEDTDAGGVVYHANYLRFMERARSDMLRSAGIAQRDAMEAGTGVYVIAEIGIRYRLPARLDDALLIESRIADIGASSCAIQQRVMRGREVLADAEVKAVLVGPDGRPKRQPREWVDIFVSLQKDA